MRLRPFCRIPVSLLYSALNQWLKDAPQPALRTARYARAQPPLAYPDRRPHLARYGPIPCIRDLVLALTAARW